MMNTPTLFFLILVAPGLFRVVAAGQAAAALTSCALAGGSCDGRVTSQIAISNSGNRSTDSARTAIIDIAALVNQGVVFEVNDFAEVTVSKSAVEVAYPLTFVKEFNARATERLTTTNLVGEAYHTSSNPCVDSDSVFAACGVITEGGARVPYSQGFCCGCDAGSYDPLSGSGSRSDLQCGRDPTHQAQAAYCLRWDPLWYAGYAIGPPEARFAVSVTVRHCPQAAAGNGSSPACNSATAVLSPTTTDVCLEDLLPLSGAVSGGCGVRVRLLDDLAGPVAAPGLVGELLMAPRRCEGEGDLGACQARLAEDPRRWLLIGKDKLTEDKMCGKVGTSYGSFSRQFNRCGQPMHSCTNSGQLDDFYDQDMLLLRRDETPLYMVGYAQQAALGQFLPPATAGALMPSDANHGELLMAFDSGAVQASTVQVEIDASRIDLRPRISPVELELAVQNWTLSNDTATVPVTTVLRNLGRWRSEFRVSIACVADDAWLLAERLNASLPANESEAFQWQLELNHTAVMDSSSFPRCEAQAWDRLGRLAAASEATIELLLLPEANATANATAREPAPMLNVTEFADGACDACSFWDLSCLFAHDCDKRAGGFKILLGFLLWGAVTATSTLVACTLTSKCLLSTPFKRLKARPGRRRCCCMRQLHDRRPAEIVVSPTCADSLVPPDGSWHHSPVLATAMPEPARLDPRDRTTGPSIAASQAV